MTGMKPCPLNGFVMNYDDGFLLKSHIRQGSSVAEDIAKEDIIRDMIQGARLDEKHHRCSWWERLANKGRLQHVDRCALLGIPVIRS